MPFKIAKIWADPWPGGGELITAEPPSAPMQQFCCPGHGCCGYGRNQPTWITMLVFLMYTDTWLRFSHGNNEEKCILLMGVRMINH